MDVWAWKAQWPNLLWLALQRLWIQYKMQRAIVCNCMNCHVPITGLNSFQIDPNCLQSGGMVSTCRTDCKQLRTQSCSRWSSEDACKQSLHLPPLAKLHPFAQVIQVDRGSHVFLSEKAWFAACLSLFLTVLRGPVRISKALNLWFIMVYPCPDFKTHTSTIPHCTFHKMPPVATY